MEISTFMSPNTVKSICAIGKLFVQLFPDTLRHNGHNEEQGGAYNEEQGGVRQTDRRFTDQLLRTGCMAPAVTTNWSLIEDSLTLYS